VLYLSGLFYLNASAAEIKWT